MDSVILLSVVVFTLALTVFAIRAVMKASEIPKKVKELTWEDFLSDVYGDMSFDDLFEKWRNRYPGRKRAPQTYTSFAKTTQTLISPRLVYQDLPSHALVYDTQIVTSAGTNTTPNGIHYMFVYDDGRESIGNNV